MKGFEHKPHSNPLNHPSFSGKIAAGTAEKKTAMLVYANRLLITIKLKSTRKNG
jgi:hypothetical protein